MSQGNSVVRLFSAGFLGIIALAGGGPPARADGGLKLGAPPVTRSLDTRNHDRDIWRVTTRDDGDLRVCATGPVQVYLRDTDGVQQLADGVWSAGTISNVHCGYTAPGTYFIEVILDRGPTGSYTIQATLARAGWENDLEPNETPATAQQIGWRVIQPQGESSGQASGHLGYRTHTTHDTVDWFKVTTTATGKLKITITAAATLDGGELLLFDTDGTTQLANDTTEGANRSLSRAGLPPGTYYIKYTAPATFGGYRIATLFSPA